MQGLGQLAQVLHCRKDLYTMHTTATMHGDLHMAHWGIAGATGYALMAKHPP